MDLLVSTRTSKAPGEYYRELNAVFGPPYYTRVDALATTEYNARPETLLPEDSKESSFREWIVAKLSHASGHARIDGLALHAAADSRVGTEALYKLGREPQGRGVPQRYRSRGAASVVHAVRSGWGAEVIASGQAR
jgi:phosphoglucomutase